MYYPLLYSVQFLFLCLPASTSTQSTGPEPCIFYCPSYAALWPRAQQHVVRAKKSRWNSTESHWTGSASKVYPGILTFPKAGSWKTVCQRCYSEKTGESQIYYFPYKVTRFSKQEKMAAAIRDPGLMGPVPLPIRTHSKWDSVALTEQVL